MNGTPWKDYGLISYISSKIDELGKTKLHKLVYLIKEIGNVPVGFNFRFYNYGPYSDNLAETLDFVSSLDGVKMRYVSSSSMYEIKPGDKSENLVEKAMPELTAYKTNIDSILTSYGNKSAKELELITTLIYANRNYDKKSETELTTVTKELKPKFTIPEIQASIAQLNTSHLLELR